jgi:hypothetical protein
VIEVSAVDAITELGQLQLLQQQNSSASLTADGSSQEPIETEVVWIHLGVASNITKFQLETTAWNGKIRSFLNANVLY